MEGCPICLHIKRRSWICQCLLRYVRRLFMSREQGEKEERERGEGRETQREIDREGVCLSVSLLLCVWLCVCVDGRV